MKDITSNKNLINKDTIYKKVVIIGNGPSGISLSYMLAGNWPYWSPEKIDKHPDELLRARLNYYDARKSLVEHDLFSLADGLEGRSTNPVSLLLDSLQNPCADLGMELPSMVEYKYHPEKEIDHLVIGRGPPGGSWHRMDPNLRTLSLAAWMSLPGLPYLEWEKAHPQLLDIEMDTPPLAVVGDQFLSPAAANQQRRLNGGNKEVEQFLAGESCQRCRELNQLAQRQDEQQQPLDSHKVALLLCNRCRVTVGNGGSTSNSVVVYEEKNEKVNVKLCPPPRRNLSLKRQHSKEVETRALISRVAEYYESYVDEMGLGKYFLNDTIVTAVLPCDFSAVNYPVPEMLRHGRWIVSGFNRLSNKSFTVVCENLVLANGASDLANRLGVKGEGLEMPWVKYDLPKLERALKRYEDNDDAKQRLKPVLIVGAGLSAADAVTMCRSSGIPVIHVYRNRTAGLDKMLPGNVYPEYHEVHKMMKDANEKHELYTPLPEHTILDLSQGGNAMKSAPAPHRVVVQHLKTGEKRELEVSFCAILIGSRPDLQFLGISAVSEQHQPQQQTIQAALEISDSALVCENRSVQPIAIWSLTEHLLMSRLARKLFWFKNICAKCRHLNVCDRNRHKQQQHYHSNNNSNNYHNLEEGRKSMLPGWCGHHPTLLGKGCECSLPIAKGTTTVDSPTLHHNHHQQKSLTPIAGTGLGEDPSKPIDCKNNPIEVDKYTNAVVRSPYRGLYAMGPLVGDNFVRFIPGGALSITSALHKQAEND